MPWWKELPLFYIVETGDESGSVKNMVLVGRYTCTPYPMLLDMPILEYIRLENAVCEILQEESERRNEKRETIY